MELNSVREIMYYSKIIDVLASNPNSTHFYGRFPYQARAVIDKIGELSSTNKQEVKMLLDAWTINFLRWGTQGDSFKEQVNRIGRNTNIELIINGALSSEEHAKIAEFYAHQNVMLGPMRYDQTLHPLILSGNNYAAFVPDDKHTRKFRKHGERPFRFGLNTQESIEDVRKYWEREIISRFKSVQKIG